MRGDDLFIAIAPGRTVYTDEYNIYGRLKKWGYTHSTVNHGRGEYARDDDARVVVDGGTYLALLRRVLETLS